MSWTAQLRPPSSEGGIRPVFPHEFSRDSLVVSPAYEECSAEVREQVDQAVEVAAHLLDSGVLGGENDSYFVSLYGHANEGHRPAEGWANDAITVTVSQFSPRG